MIQPLCIDLFCGTFSWSAGWRELGGRVVGVDIEHEAHHGAVAEGDELLLQDVRTLDGAQFADAALILASPPCQEFSYMAMPWSRAKQIGRALRGEGEFPDKYRGSRTLAELTTLFDACFRIQRQASAAAGRHIPMVVENVRGAEAWVGKRAGKFGSFYLWGDVPALPLAARSVKVASTEGRRTDVGNGTRFTSRDCGVERPPMASREQAPDPAAGTKGFAARLGDSVMSRRHGSKSSARKAASARIAMIPLALSRAVAAAYFPKPPL